MNGMSRQGDGSRSSADQSQHKSTKTMNFLDDLSSSGPSHPLFPVHLQPKIAATLAAAKSCNLSCRHQLDR